VILSCSGIQFSSLQQAWTERTLSKLTLREKIAQMMVYYMRMEFLNEDSEQWQELISLIQTDGIGGIHLWSGEVGISLTMMNELQNMSKIPILFDADIESGLHARFSNGTELPPLMAIAATENPQFAYEAGKIAASESRAVGIHWNFSPVMDVNNNPENPIINTRSFGEDPTLVGEFGLQFMKGLQEHGMLATAKHFPGHGDTETDSHSALAMIPSDSSRLWSLELKPFQTVIDAGVDAVMVAHIHAPDYQPEANRPATLSPFWVTEILRKKMGFNGVVVTDAMNMGGIVGNYSDTYAVIQAIKAGCDFILQNNHFKETIDAVEDAVNKGILTEKRIDESVLRLLKLKEKIGLHRSRNLNIEYTRRELGNKEFSIVAQKIAQNAITCVKNNENILPLHLTPDDTLYIIDLYDYGYNHAQSFVTKQIIKAGINYKSYQIDESDSQQMLDVILSKVPSNGIVIINAFSNPKPWKNRIFLPDNETDFLKKLTEKTSRIILNSLGNPYLIGEFPEIPVFLCSYKDSELMQTALANALLGHAQISGKLPVTIPEIAIRGFGIQIPNVPLKIKQNQFNEGIVLQTVMPYEIEVNLESIKRLLIQSISEHAWPGGVLFAAKNGKLFIHEPFGHHTYSKEKQVRSSDIFDLASLTKVIATTASLMKLVETGKLSLDDKLVDLLPELKQYETESSHFKNDITIRHLLQHNSGFPAFKPIYKIDGGIDMKWESIYKIDPEFSPEKQLIYSDIGFIILGKLIERVSGQLLNEYVDDSVFSPLGMNTTLFNPLTEKLHRILPTEIDTEKNLIHGIVHDENARSLGGISGHAGLFSTGYDLAIFSQMMLNEGLYGWKRIFKTETVDLFTQTVYSFEDQNRSLGWNKPDGVCSGGIFLSDSSFGQTGFTGTSLWIDPEHDLFVILLTNAVHPKREMKNPNYFDWRQKIHSAVYESLGLVKINPNLTLRKRWEKEKN